MARKIGTTVPPQNPEDSEKFEGKEFEDLAEQKRKSLLSFEITFSRVVRLGIAALGVSIFFLVACLTAMYCLFILRLTVHFFHDVPMLIDFLTETWRTITSASAAIVPFLIYLLRKEIEGR